MNIDLNADLGESFGRWTLGADAGLMPHITSANVAAGFHGGDPHVLRRTVALAVEHGAGIGAAATPRTSSTTATHRRRQQQRRPAGDPRARRPDRWRLCVAATVIDADLWKLGQLRPVGDHVRFVEAEFDEAVELDRRLDAALSS